MSPEQARAVIKREGWNFMDLYDLVCAYAETTEGCGIDSKGPRVHLIIKRLPLRKKPAKKVAR